MRSERNNLQDRIERANTRCLSLDKQVSELERQQKSLDGAVSTAQNLWYKAETIESSTDPVKKQVHERIEEYQALKQATDDFAQWSAAAYDHADAMVTLCDDEDSLRRMTGRILQTLQNSEHESIKAVCAPLKSLKLT